MCYNDYVINVKRGGYIFPAIIKQGNIKMEEEKTMQENEITFDDGLTNRSDAWLMIEELGKQNKRMFAALIAVIILWATTIGGFVWYLSRYDYSYEVYDVAQDAADGGDTNYIGNDGDIINGETKSGND